MPYASWAALARDLDSTLESLGDCQFLILGEPTPTRQPQWGVPELRPQPGATRYVQVLRVGEVLSAECVGAVSQGGTWEMSDPTIQLLRGLGWLTPEECLEEFGDQTPNFEQYVDLETARTLPDLLVASLAVLGARPEELVLEFSGQAEARA